MSGSSSWKVAYADFVTAMMAFFLLMWILNAATEETKAGLSDFFTSGGMAPDGDMAPGLDDRLAIPLELITVNNLGNNRSLSSEEEEKQQQILTELTRFLLNTQLRSNANGLASSQYGVLMTLTNEVMFEPGATKLAATGMKTLDYVVDILNRHKVCLVIRGHTSSDETVAPFPSKWDLASARANACLQYIQERSYVPPAYLRAVSYADTQPRYPEVNDAAKAMNRRVEFYFFSPSLSKQILEF